MLFAASDLVAIVQCEAYKNDSRLRKFCVVVGDLPPAAFETSPASPAKVLGRYLARFGRWVAAARSGKHVAELTSLVGEVTGSFLDAMDLRLALIRRGILPLVGCQEVAARCERVHGLPEERLEILCPSNWYSIRESLYGIEWLRSRQEFYERCLGVRPSAVWHDENMQHPHIDVYLFAPFDIAPASALLTSGMSNWPQTLGGGHAASAVQRTELLAFARNGKQRSAQLLANIARFAIERNIAISHGDTIRFPDDSNSSRTYLCVVASLGSGETSRLIIEGECVQYRWLLPITESERRFVTRCGGAALAQALRDRRVQVCLDVERKSIL